MCATGGHRTFGFGSRCGCLRSVGRMECGEAVLRGIGHHGPTVQEASRRDVAGELLAESSAPLPPVLYWNHEERAMSDLIAARRATRGKVILHLTPSESTWRALWEWGYRTPRFPRGIKGSDLSSSEPGVQKETMVAWFLANHAPALGPYFGFGEAMPRPVPSALGTFALGTRPLGGGAQIAGFGQAPFFTGGRSVDLLKAEFAEVVREDALTQVASIFEGLWELIPEAPVADLEAQTPSERSASLVGALDDILLAVEKLRPEHGGIGHNMPPGNVSAITEEDKAVVLTATAKTRLAVLSGDYSMASTTWQAISPIVKRLADGIAKQIENLFTSFTATIGVASGLLGMAYIGYELGFWNKAEAISAMLEIAKHLAH